MSPRHLKLMLRQHYALKQALNDDDLSRIINCESTSEIWNTLIVTHEGISQIKRAKIDLLTSQYKNFQMHENESVNDMLTYFSKITNNLISLVNRYLMIIRCGRSSDHFPNRKSRQPP